MISKIKEISALLLDDLNVRDDFEKRDIAKIKDSNVVLIGMRRLGKTEYLKYRARISGFNADEIIFLNFDLPFFSNIDFHAKGNKFMELINAITDILISKKIKLVLFDEVQVIKNWARLLKGFIDMFPKITFVATGSDALDLMESSETGVGRFKLLFVGPTLFKEIKNMKGKITLVDYIDDYSFPQGQDFKISERYQAIIEKQILLSKISKKNIDSTLRAIALNPGIRMTRTTLARKINEESDCLIDNKQVENILDFLIKSNLVISIADISTAQRATIKQIFTLYPYDWNMYKYYEINKTYPKLNSKIEKGVIDANLPTKGFVFENMIISNVYSSLTTLYDKNRLFNKVSIPDIDFILDKTNYEVKSFDVLASPENIIKEITNKSNQVNSKVIHTGISAVVEGVTFINANEFLLNL